MSAKTIAIFVLICVLLVAGMVFLTARGEKTEAKFTDYTLTNNERPKIDIPITKIELGEMKVSDVKQADFTITNKGTKPLQIGYINSSCSCTVGQVIYGGKTSREYGMHDPGQDLIDVAPNTSAIVRVIYRPAVMPVFGAVEREVYVQTNDPEKKRLVLQVTASVK